MRCDEARPLISAWLDGEPVDDAGLEAHLSGCAPCSSYQGRLEAIRTHLRLEPLEAVPNVLPAVLAAIPRRRPRSRAWPVTAAGFGMGLLAGVLLLGSLRGTDPILAASIHEKVSRAQRSITSLRLEFTITERGFHPLVPVRTYAGSLAYQAPERAVVHIVDSTLYPSSEWVANDLDLVIDGTEAWARTTTACPAPPTDPEKGSDVVPLPACTEPSLEVVTGRDPFSTLTPSPLEMVVPVSAFRLESELEHLQARPGTVGVAMTAAQASDLLDDLLGSGQWRALYPGDRAEVVLDAETAVPVEVSVFPSESPDRLAWAARRGYDDPTGEAILEWRVTKLRTGVVVSAPPAPAPADRDLGFRPERLAPPVEAPEGFALVSSGTLAGTRLWAWSDGRAWLRVEVVEDWEGPGMFGSGGRALRPIDTGIYTDGSAAYVHGVGADAVVRGSVSEQALIDLAVALPLAPAPLPADWPAMISVETAAAILPGLLVAEVSGFDAPAVALVDERVMLEYRASGARAFRLLERPGDLLTPPIDPDARALELRGTVARYSPALGELEWVEGGLVISLSSPSLDPGELVVIAEGLQAP
jgi:hypothetical protein